MMALDTNVIVRLLVRDEPGQLAAAEGVLREGQMFFVPDLVVAEAVWVLRRAYGWEPARVLEALRGLLSLSDVELEDEDSVAAATEAYAEGGDWSDHLIRQKARNRGCQGIYSFDAEFRKRDPEFVVEPGSG